MVAGRAPGHDFCICCWKVISMNSAGRLIATNVESRNPSHGWMELAVDWYLFHRSHGDFARLWNSLGDEAEVWLVAEDAGVNLFLDVRNN